MLRRQWLPPNIFLNLLAREFHYSMIKRVIKFWLDPHVSVRLRWKSFLSTIRQKYTVFSNTGPTFLYRRWLWCGNVFHLVVMISIYNARVTHSPIASHPEWHVRGGPWTTLCDPGWSVKFLFHASVVRKTFTLQRFSRHPRVPRIIMDNK